MADYTTNYNLKKPAGSDFYNIADFNDNADIIDTALNSKLEKDLSNISGGAIPVANGGTGATTASGAINNLNAAAKDLSNVTGTLPISHGGTGATTAENARANLGLGVSDKVTIKALELTTTTPYVDFHYNYSENDYDMRIINEASNTLNVTAYGGNYANLQVEGATVETQGRVHFAGHGLYNGYTFVDDMGNDTGMFSTGDGDLQFFANAVKLLYTYNGRLVFPNGTVYVCDSQPDAPDGSLWAW